MSNYVTIRQHRAVCQFSWCPQREASPLWPVIKLRVSASFPWLHRSSFSLVNGHWSLIHSSGVIRSCTYSHWWPGKAIMQNFSSLSYFYLRRYVSNRSLTSTDSLPNANEKPQRSRVRQCELPLVKPVRISTFTYYIVQWPATQRSSYC